MIHPAKEQKKPTQVFNNYDYRQAFMKTSSNILTHFHANFFQTMSEKRTSGQPVTLTDLFGMVIGDALLDVSCLKI